MSLPQEPDLVLALYPSTIGLGFAVFDGPDNPIDWGYCDIRLNHTARTVTKLKALVELYQPQFLVLEDPSDPQSKREKRIKKLILSLTKSALSWDVPVRHYTYEHSVEIFGRKTKRERVNVICGAHPELESSKPPKRMPWEPEHPQMQVFDAASLALTHFYHEV